MVGPENIFNGVEE